ncbi:MAG: hypothetical protein MUE60_15640, partial [Candidatus Eisenbacteria bacterium]|nr:hypothetical protein [Candidatus Eisenbacteria bacterium]
MKGRHVALQGLAALSRAGAQKASCTVSSSEQHELTADAGRLSLLRTTFQSSVGMMAIRDQRRGASGTNKTTPEALESLASDTLGIARASQPDEAYDIAEHQPSGVFSLGPEDADRSAMLASLSQFLETCRLRYPAAIIEQAILQFTRTVTHVVNTNGVDFAVTK